MLFFLLKTFSLILFFCQETGHSTSKYFVIRDSHKSAYVFFSTFNFNLIPLLWIYALVIYILLQISFVRAYFTRRVLLPRKSSAALGKFLLIKRLNWNITYIFFVCGVTLSWKIFQLSISPERFLTKVSESFLFIWYRLLKLESFFSFHLMLRPPNIAFVQKMRQKSCVKPAASKDYLLFVFDIFLLILSFYYWNRLNFF